jgi:hypothetical protein
MKRTLKKELKEYEIVTRESNNAWLVLIYLLFINLFFVFVVVVIHSYKRINEKIIIYLKDYSNEFNY